MALHGVVRVGRSRRGLAVRAARGMDLHGAVRVLREMAFAARVWPFARAARRGFVVSLDSLFRWRVDEGGERTGGARGPGAIASKTKFQRVDVFFCRKPARLQNVLFVIRREYCVLASRSSPLEVLASCAAEHAWTCHLCSGTIAAARRLAPWHGPATETGSGGGREYRLFGWLFREEAL